MVDTNLKNCVDLSIACKNLPNKDSFSRTDAYVTVHLQTIGIDTTPRNLGRTEVVKDTLNPKFSKSFVVDYFFERRQVLRFTVVDSDGKSKEGDAIGEATCEFGEIMGSRGQCLSLPLTDKGKPVKSATLQVYADEIKKDSFAGSVDSTEFKDLTPEVAQSLSVEQLERLLPSIPKEVPKVERVLQMEWYGTKLDKKDLLGKSDPYIKILRHRGDETVSVFQSETIKNTLNPVFAPFEITFQKLANNDLDAKLTIQCWDWDRTGEHDLIGECSLTAKELTESKGGTTVFDLINPEKKLNPKKKKKYEGYKNSGTLHVKSCFFTAREMMEPNPKYVMIAETLGKKKLGSGHVAGVRDLSTFIQYLAGGLEISIIFGVDFTGSNGVSTSSSSLHYLGGSHLNAYQEAISAVGQIVQHYDKDKLFPAYGYGASIKSEGQTLGEFSLQGFVKDDKKEDPHDLSLRSKGIDGVLQAYKAAVPNLSFGDMGSAKKPGGGRYMGDDFYQLINIAVDQVGQVTQTDQKYSVLLLIIDGDYFDNQSTIDAIVGAGDKPISIIIIGVGNSSFPNCRKFDADDEPLVNRQGKKMTRDIVQFVKFNDFKDDPAKLAAEVLAELPNQAVQFLQQKGIYPNSRIRVEL